MNICPPQYLASSVRGLIIIPHICLYVYLYVYLYVDRYEFVNVGAGKHIITASHNTYLFSKVSVQFVEEMKLYNICMHIFAPQSSRLKF